MSERRGRGRGKGRGSGRGSGRGRGRGRGGAKEHWKGKNKHKGSYNSQTDRDYGFTVKVIGFPDGTSKPDLLSFLEEKSADDFSPTSVKFNSGGKGGRFMILELTNKSEALSLIKLSGIRFGGEKLNVQWNKSGKKVHPQEKMFIARSIETRYDSTECYLSLANVGGTAFDDYTVDMNAPSFLPALWEALQASHPSTKAVSLANNNLRNTGGFKSAGYTLQNLESLFLEGNAISSLKQLNPLRGIPLRHLVLTGNPIVPSEMDEAGVQRYRNEMARIFPKLKSLDDRPILPIINFRLPESVLTDSVPPTKGSWADSSSTKDLAVQFLREYFKLYDSDRGKLFDLYADTSYFSLCTPPISRKRDDDGRKKGKQQRKDWGEEKWTAYAAVSRNLAKVGDQQDRVTRLKGGKIDIVYTLKALPASRTDFKDMIVDTFRVVGTGEAAVVCVVLHGSFWEVSNDLNRSFSRTFLLGNVGDGYAGSSLKILNDQLQLRDFSLLPSRGEAVVGSAAPSHTFASGSSTAPSFTFGAQNTSRSSSAAQHPLLKVPSMVSFDNPFKKNASPPKVASAPGSKFAVASSNPSLVTSVPSLGSPKPSAVPPNPFLGTTVAPLLPLSTKTTPSHPLMSSNLRISPTTAPKPSEIASSPSPFSPFASTPTVPKGKGPTPFLSSGSESEGNVLSVTSFSNPREPMIREFMKKTRLTKIYANACLEKNDWEFEKAFNNFQQLKRDRKIPIEGFQR